MKYIFLILFLLGSCIPKANNIKKNKVENNKQSSTKSGQGQSTEELSGYQFFDQTNSNINTNSSTHNTVITNRPSSVVVPQNIYSGTTSQVPLRNRPSFASQKEDNSFDHNNGRSVSSTQLLCNKNYSINLENAIICPGDNVGASSSSTQTLGSVCTFQKKCEYICSPGAYLTNGSCFRPNLVTREDRDPGRFNQPPGESTPSTDSNQTGGSQAPDSLYDQLGRSFLQIKLTRYFNKDKDDHWVTIKSDLPVGYIPQASVNIYHPNQSAPEDSIAIYSCLAGSKDHMISGDPECEGTTKLRVNA